MKNVASTAIEHYEVNHNAGHDNCDGVGAEVVGVDHGGEVAPNGGGGAHDDADDYADDRGKPDLITTTS